MRHLQIVIIHVQAHKYMQAIVLVICVFVCVLLYIYKGCRFEPWPSHSKDFKMVPTAFLSGTRCMTMEWESLTSGATSGPTPAVAFTALADVWPRAM